MNNINFTHEEMIGFIRKLLELYPEAAEPVKHGRWLETPYCAYDDTYKCSVCGEEWEFIEGTPQDNGANYCPNCGTRMIDEVEE